MKGGILTRFPAARIIDVTHDILVHWPAEAGFWLSRSWSYFPAGSVHVAVVDPGVGTKRDIIVVTAAEHLFLAPDNGLLAPVIGRIGVGDDPSAGAASAGALLHRARRARPFTGATSLPRSPQSWPPGAAAADLGDTTSEFVPAWVDEPELIGQAVRGVVITLDHFGNLDHQHRPGAAAPLHPAGRARGQPSLPIAPYLRRRAAGGVPGAGQLLRCSGGRPR